MYTLYVQGPFGLAGKQCERQLLPKEQPCFRMEIALSGPMESESFHIGVALRCCNPDLVTASIAVQNTMFQ